MSSRPTPTMGERMVLDRLILESLLGRDGAPLKLADGWDSIVMYVRRHGRAVLGRFNGDEIRYLCDLSLQAMKREGRVRVVRGHGWLRVPVAE